jgi:hypothetical protein
MKKFLAIIAVAAFVACNNSGESKDAAAADSARIADSTKTADSLKAVQQMQQADTMHKDTMGAKPAMKDTSANKMKKK